MKDSKLVVNRRTGSRRDVGTACQGVVMSICQQACLSSYTKVYSVIYDSGSVPE